MLGLVRMFWEICRLKKGPEDVPAASLLLVLLVGVNFFLSVLQGVWDAQLELYLKQGVLLLFVEVGLIYGVLSLRGYDRRFNQTFSALLGTGLIIWLFFLPFQGLYRTEILDSYAYVNLYLIFTIWRIIVSAHIFRSAFAIPLWLGVVFSLMLYLLELSIQLSMEPEPA